MHQTRLFSQYAGRLPEDHRAARMLAIISTFLITFIGIVYFIFMLILMAGGGMVMPPADYVQTFGGIVTLLSAVLLPIMFTSVHRMVPPRRKVFSSIALAFCIVFAVLVGINRFVQLSVVRLSILEGNTEGLARFLPYDGRSALFALEMAGWGLFLSLAAFFLAFALGKKGLNTATRWTFLVYFVLGTVSAIAFMIGSPLSVIGFAAWGLVLYIGTLLLMLSLIKYDKYWAEV